MVEQVEAAFQDAYNLLLSAARALLLRERAPISTVTLAHELYLSLRDRPDLKFESRQKFLAYASRAMRSLLVDMARERLAKKRAAELLPLTLGEDVPDYHGTPEELVALDEALQRLGSMSERQLRVAEMRIFGGMSIKQVADELGVSEPTVKRDWQLARAFLFAAVGAKHE